MTLSVEHDTTLPTGEAVSQWLHLITADYREMPCLRLTKPQMRRLWGLDSAICDAVVEALVGSQVLRRRADGTYVAASDRR